MENEIDLWSLLKFYLKYWYVVLIFAVAGLAIGFVYNTTIQTPLFQSDTKVTFVNTGASPARTVRDISNYADLVKSRSVLSKAIRSSGQNVSFDDISRATIVKNDKNTDTLDISVTSTNAERSRVLANGVTRAFVQEVVSVYDVPAEEVRIIDNAQRNDTPVNVRASLQLLIATSAGIIIAFISLFFAFDYANSHRNTPRKNTEKRQRRQKDGSDDDINLPGYLLDDLDERDTQASSSATESAHPIKRPGEKYKKTIQ